MGIEHIIQEIKDRQTFYDVNIKEFAPEGRWAHQVAGSIKGDTRMTQLRKVFHELKRIQLEQKGKRENDPFDEEEIYLLIPQLAYARARNLISPDFYELMKTIIGDGKETKLHKVRDYQRFVEFVTAIVAYHKEKE